MSLQIDIGSQTMNMTNNPNQQFSLSQLTISTIWGMSSKATGNYFKSCGGAKKWEAYWTSQLVNNSIWIALNFLKYDLMHK